MQSKNKAVVILSVALTLAICIVLVAIVFQFITINNLNTKKQQLQAQIEYNNHQAQVLQGEIDYIQDAELLEDMYRSAGYSKDGDIVFK